MEELRKNYWQEATGAKRRRQNKKKGQGKEVQRRVRRQLKCPKSVQFIPYTVGRKLAKEIREKEN